jgi:hypothetical protein
MNIGGEGTADLPERCDRGSPRAFAGTRRPRSSDFLREPDEESFGTSDVAEPIRVFVPDQFADELRAALA